MASSPPWRRGGTTTPRDMESRWSTSNPTSPPSTRSESTSTTRTSGGSTAGNGGISRGGFRMARNEIGKKPAELDMLLSPSRGLQGGEQDEVSLRNPEVQQRFRQHIDGKLRKWAAIHPPSLNSTPDQSTRRDEELSIILLDLRKLREGITSSRRVDVFACEVYEASALLSLFASNNPQLSSSMPHLVQSLHPALARPSSSSISTFRESALATSLSALSLCSPPPDASTRAFFLTLHLLHLHLLPAYAKSAMPASPSSFSAAPSLSSFLPTLHSLLAASSLPPPSWRNSIRHHSDPHVAFLLSLYTALLRHSHNSLARLLSALPSPPPSVSAHLAALHLPSVSSFHPLSSLLRTALPALRTHRIWPGIARAYKFPPDRTAWLAKGLLYEFEVGSEGWKGLEMVSGKAGVESWEDEVENEEDCRRKEAERRAADWVKARKAGA